LLRNFGRADQGTIGAWMCRPTRMPDSAIAEAVTEYTRLRERSMVEGETERSGVFAHELRNRISAAQHAFLAIKSGRAPTNGSVAAIVTLPSAPTR
jgi:hypothetical protein